MKMAQYITLKSLEFYAIILKFVEIRCHCRNVDEIANNSEQVLEQKKSSNFVCAVKQNEKIELRESTRIVGLFYQTRRKPRTLYR